MTFYSKKVKEQYDVIFENMDNDGSLTVGDILTEDEIEYYELGLISLNNFIKSLITEKKETEIMAFSEYMILIKSYVHYCYEEINDNDEIKFIEEMIRLTNKINNEPKSQLGLEMLSGLLYEEYYLK